MDNILIIIPARGGSKGIPRKNIKEINGKPLIYYSIDAARSITDDAHICVTTDDEKIIKCVEDYGLHVPFIRPQELATDQAGSNDVILHALNYYEKTGAFDCIVLLQPTSPFRKKVFLEEALSLYSADLDMVVSVKEATANPYYNCFEENKNGHLSISKGNGMLERRQDAPPAYEYNGSIFIINPLALKEKGLSNFTKIKKYLMDDLYSVDIDTPFDWLIAETILKNKILSI